MHVLFVSLGRIQCIYLTLSELIYRSWVLAYMLMKYAEAGETTADVAALIDLGSALPASTEPAGLTAGLAQEPPGRWMARNNTGQGPARPGRSGAGAGRRDAGPAQEDAGQAAGVPA
jgi:hypothetical protein